MNRLKKILLFFYLILATLSFSQTEVGLFTGTSFFHGDVGYNSLNFGNTDKLFINSKAAIGLNFRKNFNSRIAFNLAFKKGQISSYDRDSEDLFIKQRNLDFKSNIMEMSSHFEFNFSPYKIGSKKFNKSIYVFTGISGFKFNPKGYYNGSWVELQPLGTEGQGSFLYPEREKYKLFAVGVPIGIGYKLNLNNNLALNIAWSWTLTKTDYIDDVSLDYVNSNLLSEQAQNLANKSYTEYVEGSQRGNSENMDKFGFFGISLVYKIPKKTFCSQINY
mgnify:CR=1 FL=1